MSKEGGFTGNFRHKHRGKNTLTHVEISVVIFEKDGIHYIYCPPLDITGYGKTEKQAKESFETTLDIFLDYTHKKGTLFDELEKLGWAVNRKKRKLFSPSFEDLIGDNETLQEALSQKHDIRKQQLAL